MWKHALTRIACPRCKSDLALDIFEQESIPVLGKLSGHDTVPYWIETGVLRCDGCSTIFPIHKGVPILLTYKTKLAERAVASWPSNVRQRLIGKALQLASGKAPRGEKFVGASFSIEWASYEYGSTLWIAPTVDRLKTFRGECGLNDGALLGKCFIEIGCGLGILTNEAAIGLGAEAWGMDLSSSIFRAASQFRTNPQAHFVQASVFASPFKAHEFDFLYSHGVLHHTWSTKEAVMSALQLLRPGGRTYIWLYGYDDVRINVARKLAYVIEGLTRPLIARLPPILANIFLWPAVPLYQIASFFGRRSGTHGSIYSGKEAIHAARDRLTPLYAHRHEYDEVAGWLKEFGFKDIHRVQQGEVAPSWSLAIDRNVAIRAIRN
jgi:SAM-dependent methyltransferase/uncharacterized protein YbaR (Trm112 family)